MLLFLDMLRANPSHVEEDMILLAIHLKVNLLI